MALPVSISPALGDQPTGDKEDLPNTSYLIIISSDDLPDNPYDSADSEIAKHEVSESDEISAAEDSMSTDDDSSAIDSGVTQAEVYDNLKRIGELEDEKRRIQEEIWNRTEQLRAVVKHIDRGSILYKILESALSDFTPKSGTASGRKTASSKGAPKVPATALKKKSHRK
jgi:hypothetical protein